MRGNIPDYVTERRHMIDNVMAFLWNPYEFVGFGWVDTLIKYSIDWLIQWTIDWWIIQGFN